MQRISPCLWFDDKAEEAAKFHASVFPNSRTRTFEAMLKMKKLDIAALEPAHAG